MNQTIEAIVDEQGHVKLLGTLHLNGPRRALLTVLDEPAGSPTDTAPLSSDEFDRLLDEISEGTAALPSLPADFSRHDVYADRD